MKPLYILKIGGSVATFKNARGISIRDDLLKNIAISIKKAKVKKDFDLVLLHGSGAGGHQLAKKYNLGTGICGNRRKFWGSLTSSNIDQKLNNGIFEIFISQKLPVLPAHTASVIMQKNKKINKCNIEIIKESIKRNCIPLLYGEMTFDEELDFSICSSDAIAPYLAIKLGAKKIFFASDIDGIFDKDPHFNNKANLIENIELNSLMGNKKIKLTGSHNVDVTEGLLGKIKNLFLKHNKTLKSVEIFNGIEHDNYRKALLGKKFSHTIIKISK